MPETTSKTEWIKRRARELWQREGSAPDQEQACWDKAVQEFEAGTSEDDRGPVKPDPAVEQEEPVHKP